MSLVIKLLALLVGMLSTQVFASDYLDSPITKANRPIDLNDVYVWKDKIDSSKLNIALTISSQDEIPSDVATMFTSKGKYSIHFDVDSDFAADRVINFYFGGNSEFAMVLDEIDIQGILGFSREENGITVYAGLRQNPAAADIHSIDAFLSKRERCLPTAETGFACKDGAAASPSNTFEGHVAASIVLQIPISLLTTAEAPTFQVWAQSWEIP